MRKIAAIFFFLIFAFNLGGYRLVISLLQIKADAKLEVRIDNSDYDESQLIEMRVSLHMAYQARYTDYERHYGEITIDGKEYSYVKRKMEGDVLVLKCIANESKQQLTKTANNLAKSSAGQDQENNDKKNSSSLKTNSGDYDDKNLFCSLSAHDRVTTLFTTRYSSTLNDVLIRTLHQPPKVS